MGVDQIGVEALQLESSARHVVFESEQIGVWCYPKWRLVYHQIHQRCHGAPFRSALLAGAQAMQQYKAISWLSDDRLNGAMPSEDEEWGASMWFPQAKAAGWKYWGLVLPDKAVGKLFARRLVQAYRERGIEVQIFEEPRAAAEWLHERHASAP